VNCLLARSAEAIQLQARRFNRKSRFEAREAADIGALLAGCRDASADDVLDMSCLKSGALDKSVQGLREQVHGMNAVERSVRFPTPDRGANSIDDEYIHMLSPHANQEIESGQ
jgi:hypothetical protein